MISRGSEKPGVGRSTRPLRRSNRRARCSATLIFTLGAVLLGSACQTDLRGREQVPSQAQHPQPPVPHVGVLADPCSENPDTWQGSCTSWPEPTTLPATMGRLRSLSSRATSGPFQSVRDWTPERQNTLPDSGIRVHCCDVLRCGESVGQSQGETRVRAAGDPSAVLKRSTGTTGRPTRSPKFSLRLDDGG